MGEEDVTWEMTQYDIYRVWVVEKGRKPDSAELVTIEASSAIEAICGALDWYEKELGPLPGETLDCVKLEMYEDVVLVRKAVLG